MKKSDQTRSFKEIILSYFEEYFLSETNVITFGQKSIPWKDMSELQARMTCSPNTNSKNPQFFEQRKAIYSKILDKIFMKPDGKMITPTTGQRRRFILVSPHTSARQEFARRLLKNDINLPKKLRTEFQKINNGHAVVLNYNEIAKQLPEYQAAVEEGYPYAAHMVYREIDAFKDAVNRFAKEKGYNIISFINTHEEGKSDIQIDSFKGKVYAEILNQKSGHETRAKHRYKLTSCCLVGDVDTVVSQPMESIKNLPAYIKSHLLKTELKSIAEPSSYPLLMKQSDNSFLVWDNGKTFGNKLKFTLAASSEKGKHSFYNRQQWNCFKQSKYLNNPPMEVIGKGLQV